MKKSNLPAIVIGVVFGLMCLLIACMVLGIILLMLWIPTLSDSEPDSPELHIKVTDSYSTNKNDGEFFNTSDDLIRIEQMSDSTDWRRLDAYLSIENNDRRYHLEIATINGQPYDYVNNYESKTGDIVILRSTVDNVFKNGDSVKLIITLNDGDLYQTFITIY